MSSLEDALAKAKKEMDALNRLSQTSGAMTVSAAEEAIKRAKEVESALKDTPLPTRFMDIADAFAHAEAVARRARLPDAKIDPLRAKELLYVQRHLHPPR